MMENIEKVKHLHPYCFPSTLLPGNHPLPPPTQHNFLVFLVVNKYVFSCYIWRFKCDSYYFFILDSIIFLHIRSYYVRWLCYMALGGAFVA
jgi:hypothetical protein